MMIPFSPFEPDKSPFETGASATVINAQPVANGWGPMAGLNVVSDALPEECRGAVYVQTAAGTITIIAGTATKLYRLDLSDYSWEDISGSTYNLDPQHSWSFAVFGNSLIATNINDPVQAYDIEAAGNFANLGGSPPQARYCWVAGDFLVLGYLAGSNGAKSVRWSGLNNSEKWTIGKDGADYQELPEGEEVMGGFSVPGGFYVIQRYAMQFFPYSPTSGFTFTRSVINPKQGSAAPRSIVSIGPGRFFYLSEDGFFAGTDRLPIGSEKIDRWFFNQIDASYITEVQGYADPFEKIVWWKFRATTGVQYRLGYDWQLDRWCVSDIPVGEMVSLAIPGVTWDGLGDIYASIDAISVPFDSRTFNGDRPTFATFTSDNRLAWFSGQNLEATFNTAQIQPDGLNRSFINGARVVTDAPLVFTLSDGVSDYHGGAMTWSTPASAHSRTGLVGMRSDGRLHQLQLSIPEGVVWSIVTSVDINVTPSGES